MYPVTSLLSLLYILLDLVYVQCKTTTPKTEESSFEVANQICLEKTGYQPLDNNAYFRVVETPMFGNVSLPCTYCGEKGDDLPKTWFWKKREVGAEERELVMGLLPNLTENRIFTLPDNSLRIQLVTTNDTGFYYCRTLVEGDFSQFHFSLDVVQTELAVNEERKDGNGESDFQRYNEKVITKANENIYKESNQKFNKDFDKVAVKIVSEWDPWLPCDGCSGIRKRYAKCRLRSKLNKAKYPEVEEHNLNETQRLLLDSTVLSCHSLDLARWLPNLYTFTSLLPNYLRVHQCQDACVKENRMLHEALYSLEYKMDAGSSMFFICPDADLRTKVVWRKGSSIMKPIGAVVEKPVKKKKFSLPSGKKTDEYKFKHAFIDRMNVLQLCYVGFDESGLYTCYIENKPIKSINITVVTPEETLRERHYHFILLTVYTWTLSGAIVVMGMTWVILQRNELFQTTDDQAESKLSLQLVPPISLELKQSSTDNQDEYIQEK